MADLRLARDTIVTRTLHRLEVSGEFVGTVTVLAEGAMRALPTSRKAGCMVQARTLLVRLLHRSGILRLACAAGLALLFLVLTAMAGRQMKWITVLVLLPGAVLAVPLLPLFDLTGAARPFLADDVVAGPEFYVLLSIASAFSFWWAVISVLLGRHLTARRTRSSRSTTP